MTTSGGEFVTSLKSRDLLASDKHSADFETKAGALTSRPRFTGELLGLLCSELLGLLWSELLGLLCSELGEEFIDSLEVL